MSYINKDCPLSILFGPAFQTGYLVEALAPALDHWTRRCGIGPFFILPPRRFDALSVHGCPADDHAIIADVALAYSGDLQIELIVPGPAPSTYRDHIGRRGYGLHHLGVACDDYDRQRAAALARGFVATTEGRSPLARFAYMEPRGPGEAGSIIELIEMNPAIADIFAHIKDAARNWDGRDPVRRL